MRFSELVYCYFFLISFTYGSISKSTLNCKYQLIPEFINGIGHSDNELYYSEIRAITHKPENKIFLNIGYESIVTVSIEKSFDSDLELSYLLIKRINNESFVSHGNLTWGTAGNNTRLFLRSRLDPSNYVITIGSNFFKNKDEIEKIDNSFCSPINFEFGLTTPEILNSQNSLLPNDPFNRVAVTLSVDEKYQYSNKVGDSFIIKTIPQNINSQSEIYKGNIIWSKLFIIPPKFKEENLLDLYVELGFKYSRVPLQLVIEPLRIDQAKYESGNSQMFKNSSRFFFGTSIFNGQMFRETIAPKSFRIIIIIPWMSNIPKYVPFDLKISVSFQISNYQITNGFLTNQNECNLPDLPKKLVQDGLYSDEVQKMKRPDQILPGQYYFNSKIRIQGPFKSLNSKTNHIINIKITRPSIIYLISYHDHSDIAVTLSKLPTLSEEDEDREFYLEYDDDFLIEIDNSTQTGAKNRISFCTTRNMNKHGVTIKEINLIYCKIDQPDDYYLHLHSFKISESQNSVSLCTPYYLQFEVIPYLMKEKSCDNPIGLDKYHIPINNDLNKIYITKQFLLLNGFNGISNLNENISLLHTQEFEIKDIGPNYLSIQLLIPEDLSYILFINVLFHNEIWISLSPQGLKSFYVSSGPLAHGVYKIQLFGMTPEKSSNYNFSCISFDVNLSIVKLSPPLMEPNEYNVHTHKSDQETSIIQDEQFIKCKMMHMPLPKLIDLRNYSKKEDYIIEGTYLTPLYHYERNNAYYESSKSDFVFKDASYIHKINILLSSPSTLLTSITNYPGMVIIHTRNSENSKISSNNLNSFFTELNEGKHELILEFDFMEDSIDETIEEGECQLVKFHLSITSIQELPIFPPLIIPDLYKYVMGSLMSNSNNKSTWSHIELFSVSREYLEKLFPKNEFSFDLTKLFTINTQRNESKYIVNKGNSIEIAELSFWFSPFMNISVPIVIDFEETSFIIRMSIYPLWLPISVKLTQLNSNSNKQNVLRSKTVHYNGNNIEFVYSNLRKGLYSLNIYSRSQFTKVTMSRSALMKLSGTFKPILKTRLFSLRQELLGIPDILPFQEIPDSLNRIRFFPTNQESIVGTIMFHFKEIRRTTLRVPKNTTLLVRLLSEPTLISGYEFYVDIFKIKEEDKFFDNQQIFRSGKYGDTLVLLTSGEYEIYFSPKPSNMPYLITLGITKFSPFELENYYRKYILPSKTSDEILYSYKNNDNRNYENPDFNDLLIPRFKCHYYLENFKIKMNEKNDLYFNSGTINICQGSLPTTSKKSTFTSNFYDVELNVGASSMVYIQTNSDFLYSFYRIGIIVPEGYWVAEQRGIQSYLEVELTRGQYVLRIESLNSFTSFEEHEMVLFSIFVEISPIDGSETFSGSTQITNSADFSTKYKNTQRSNDSKCHIPNGVPLPLDLTSIQGGSTVFGGPIDVNNSMFVFRSRIILTDIHNGRKKVFLESNKNRFPIYLRLSISPVNFDISNSPTLLEILFTRIDSRPINPIYTNSDNVLNSIEKVFKIDNDVIQIEQKGATNIPFWLIFTHKLDSVNTRQSCIAFDIILHFVSIEDKELKYLGNAPYSNSASSWFEAIQAQLDRALSVKKFPHYIHLPPTNNIISIDSKELQTNILINLENKSVNQVFLIVELFYNPLIISSKINIYSDSNETGDSLTFLRSSTLNFNGNITNPFYAKERLALMVVAQKYILEYYIISLPPYNMKNIPMKMGISVIPIDHNEFKDKPLILSISPDQSVPILSGQNYHLSIKLSVPLKNKNSENISKSFYIIGKIEDLFENQISPYHTQVLDAGYTVSISFSYLEIIKVLTEKSDQFSKRGFLVINTNYLTPINGNSIYKLAPWINSYIVKKKYIYLEISCYKPNAVGWASIVWNGSWEKISFSKKESNQIVNLRNRVLEKSSFQKIRESSNSRHAPFDETSVNKNRNFNNLLTTLYNFRHENSNYPKENKEYVVRSMVISNKRWIYIIIVLICAFIIYVTPIFKLIILMKELLYSRFSNYESNKINEYNLIEQRNDFDFLSNVISDDEDDDNHINDNNQNHIKQTSLSNRSYERSTFVRYLSPNYPGKSD